NERVDANYSSTISSLDQVSVELRENLNDNSGVITRSYAQAVQALESANPEAVRALLNAGFAQRVQVPIDRLQEATARESESAQFILDYSRTRSITYMLVNAGLGLSGLIAALILGYYISRSITQPVLNLTQVVSRVAEGDLSSRAHLSGYDEVTQLGDGLDRLLDDKVSTLAQAEEENAQLNDSVIKLLRAVSRLSQRDLTVRVPVTEDVTGPVADAINQLTTETNRVLLDVAEVADQVADASSLVNEKASLVNDAAAAQGKEVTETAEQLSAAAARLGEIAEIARQCNDLASQTTTMTDTAVSSVHSTLSGMNNIREVIQETGKRIKRLGERSQEISGVVDIINRITERTTVLALNASMQAAAAGEAGRGFAVVADEVQRLAESSRNATAQIASLVKSIQVETNDTISTMDQAINQVVEGSKLAEGAGERMNETRASTSALVESVLQIVSSSQEQAELSKYLRDRAEVMLERSTETGREVRDQLEQTNSMAEYAQHLLASVRQFQLAPVG
ncbi:MAG: methyl-accepting chemotaxis protein, partial [Xanthomonadales bacterium]|nr:methyl-accepting chemotaxis protein [Xanthomonadales bacterium]